MNDHERKQLVDAALSARDNAYAPYSGFRVGAAVLTTTGRTYGGCNVENASYGLTICAERVALATAAAAGDRQFVALAVATPGGALPCGACRQFAAEFRHDLPILIVNADQPETVRETNLSKLLPEQFQLREQN